MISSELSKLYAIGTNNPKKKSPTCLINCAAINELQQLKTASAASDESLQSAAEHEISLIYSQLSQ